ncbi:MAG: hydrogen peroxide-inducible genes activator [Rhodospirillales bacterium]|nr:hydrogen peroxide-inducible genes activator [Rhodospirillales bacterium]
MMHLPTLRQLRYLVELMEIRHFGRAAEACHVTQSTLSAGIQELEEMLGVRLLERTKRRVVTTPIGLEIAQRARRTLDEAEGLVQAAWAGAEPLCSELRLGVIPTIGPYLLPKVLPSLRDRFPKLKLFLREDQTAHLLDQLTAGELDVLILAFPMDTPGAETLMIAKDPFWLVCPAGHPLGASKKPIAPEDIPVDELLLLEDGHCLRDHALSACKAAGRQRTNRFQGTSLHTLIEMVASGLGLTLIPDLAAGSQMIAASSLVTRPLSASAEPREIGLVWRRTSGRRPEFKLLGKALGEILKSQ